MSWGSVFGTSTNAIQITTATTQLPTRFLPPANIFALVSVVNTSVAPSSIGAIEINYLNGIITFFANPGFGAFGASGTVGPFQSSIMWTTV